MSTLGPRIVDLVFEARPARRRTLIAFTALAAVPYAVAAAALSRSLPATVPAPKTLAPIVVELPIAPPPPPPPQAPLSPRAAPRAAVAAPRSAPARVSAPPVAAAAIAAARPPGPVDLTGEVFISGEAAAPTGGPTARSGVERASPGIATRARPVSLEATRWRCPWPKQAEASDRDHETVLIRVVVAASGTARSVEVLRDPGSGFGAAAASCALATAFLPALAVDGAPIDATSPPILVRFDR